MKLSDEIKKKIQDEYDQWVKIQYGTKTKEERQKLGQFFTPPELTIKMLEKFENLDGNILDPTVRLWWIISSSYYGWSRSKKMLWN